MPSTIAVLWLISGKLRTYECITVHIQDKTIIYFCSVSADIKLVPTTTFQESYPHTSYASETYQHHHGSDRELPGQFVCHKKCSYAQHDKKLMDKQGDVVEVDRKVVIKNKVKK